MQEPEEIKCQKCGKVVSNEDRLSRVFTKDGRKDYCRTCYLNAMNGTAEEVDE